MDSSFDPASLPALVAHRSSSALASGALVPIATDRVSVDDGGIRYLVHILTGLERKRELTHAQRRGGHNPFLDPDRELVVAELSPTHRLLLNKFNVIERHLLVVTRRFAPQEDFLDVSDLAALGAAMSGCGGLGFYNAGTVAGASQPHKHLQLAPTPIGEGPLPTPVDAVLGGLAPGRIERCPGLPFAHAVIGRDGAAIAAADAEPLHDDYRRLLAAVGITRTSEPYNLLLTPRWMMLVPRRREDFEGVSVNALGFAGSLLVPDRERLELLRRIGPARVLASVAGRHDAGGRE